jgi:hypothetical protein
MAHVLRNYAADHPQLAMIELARKNDYALRREIGCYRPKKSARVAHLVCDPIGSRGFYLHCAKAETGRHLDRGSRRPSHRPRSDPVTFTAVVGKPLVHRLNNIRTGLP